MVYHIGGLCRSPVRLGLSLFASDISALVKSTNWPCILATYLNQVRAGRRPVRTWFLKIDPVWTSVCVCVSAPEAINI